MAPKKASRRRASAKDEVMGVQTSIIAGHEDNRALVKRAMEDDDVANALASFVRRNTITKALKHMKLAKVDTSALGAKLGKKIVSFKARSEQIEMCLNKAYQFSCFEFCVSDFPSFQAEGFAPEHATGAPHVLVDPGRPDSAWHEGRFHSLMGPR